MPRQMISLMAVLYHARGAPGATAKSAGPGGCCRPPYPPRPRGEIHRFQQLLPGYDPVDVLSEPPWPMSCWQAAERMYDWFQWSAQKYVSPARPNCLKAADFARNAERRRALSVPAAATPTRRAPASAHNAAPSSALRRPSAPRPGSSAERRQITVMFCDLVGSTALSTRLDPEDLRDVIAAYHTCAAEVVRRFNGFVAKYMGDGVLVYFGYPEAHEADAANAV